MRRSLVSTARPCREVGPGLRRRTRPPRHSAPAVFTVGRRSGRSSGPQRGPATWHHAFRLTARQSPGTGTAFLRLLDELSESLEECLSRHAGPSVRGGRGVVAEVQKLSTSLLVGVGYRRMVPVRPQRRARAEASAPPDGGLGWATSAGASGRSCSPREPPGGLAACLSRASCVSAAPVRTVEATAALAPPPGHGDEGVGGLVEADQHLVARRTASDDIQVSA